MCIEIEAKLKVDSLAEIREKLSGAGAKFLEERVQTDSYFDDAGRTLTKTDKCLRLRCQRVGSNEKNILIDRFATSFLFTV